MSVFEGYKDMDGNVFYNKVEYGTDDERLL